MVVIKLQGRACASSRLEVTDEVTYEVTDEVTCASSKETTTDAVSTYLIFLRASAASIASAYLHYISPLVL